MCVYRTHIVCAFITYFMFNFENNFNEFSVSSFICWIYIEKYKINSVRFTFQYEVKCITWNIKTVEYCWKQFGFLFIHFIWLIEFFEFIYLFFLYKILYNKKSVVFGCIGLPLYLINYLFIFNCDRRRQYFIESGSVFLSDNLYVLLFDLCFLKDII